MSPGAILVALMTSSTSPSPAIPLLFQGRWNPTFAACTVGEPVDEIRINATSLSYYEWTDEVTSVVPQAAGAVRIRALIWSPEADLEKPSGKANFVMRVFAGGQRLSVQFDGQQPKFYVRCKTARPDSE